MIMMKSILSSFLMLTVLCFTACETLSQQKNSSESAKTESETNVKETVVNSFKMLEKQKSWVAEMVSENDSTKKVSKITVKFLAPNDSHTVWTSEGKTFVETITTGGFEYSKIGEKWEKSKKDKLGKMMDNINSFVECSQEKYILNVESVGYEAVNGAQTAVYLYDYDINGQMKEFIEKMQLKTKPEDLGEMKARIWINSEGLPVKFESVHKSEASKGKLVTIKKTTTYNFNEVVKIEAPKM